MKTSELQGPALDWAVAKCEGWDYDDPETPSREDRAWKPSTKWAQGGPIIEREKMAVRPGGGGNWVAYIPFCDGLTYSRKFGLTPLIAAMRCYVASKLGDEIEIPKELT